MRAITAQKPSDARRIPRTLKCSGARRASDSSTILAPAKRCSTQPSRPVPGIVPLWNKKRLCPSQGRQPVVEIANFLAKEGNDSRACAFQMHQAYKGVQRGGREGGTTARQRGLLSRAGPGNVAAGRPGCDRGCARPALEAGRAVASPGAEDRTAELVSRQLHSSRSRIKTTSNNGHERGRAPKMCFCAGGRIAASAQNLDSGRRQLFPAS